MPAHRDCLPRYATPRTPSRKTLGGAAAKIAEQLGTPFMPWQRQVLDTALEIENGQFVYREVIVTVPRQSGKTTALLSLILTRALMVGNQRIMYTAQTRADARKKWFEDWIPVLKVSPFWEMIKPRMANGDESLLFDNGSRQGLVASTLKSGHGGTLDMGLVDEAFAQADGRLEQALKPAMITRNTPPHKGAQLWVVSTAGTLATSPYLWSKVDNGRVLAESGHNNLVAYFEWSAAEDADPSDEETWWSCMPALGRTATVEAVRADFLSMELHEFMRAYLNMWTAISVDPVIPIADWNALAEPGLDTSGVPVALAADVTPDRAYSSISASGTLGDGRQFVEVIAHRPGTEWIPAAIEKLIEKNHVLATVVDPVSPAVSLIDPIEKRGIEVTQVQARQVSDACASLFDAVVEKSEDGSSRFVHTGQQDVMLALDGAVKRPIGDGGWGWGRKNSGVDISPLVACTLAFWGAREAPTPGVWSLDEIVAKLRAERDGQDPTVPNGPPSQAESTGPPADNPGGVYITPI